MAGRCGREACVKRQVGLRLAHSADRALGLFQKVLHPERPKCLGPQASAPLPRGAQVAPTLLRNCSTTGTFVPKAQFLERILTRGGAVGAARRNPADSWCQKACGPLLGVRSTEADRKRDAWGAGACLQKRLSCLLTPASRPPPSSHFGDRLVDLTHRPDTTFRELFKEQALWLWVLRLERFVDSAVEDRRLAGVCVFGIAPDASRCHGAGTAWELRNIECAEQGPDN